MSDLQRAALALSDSVQQLAQAARAADRGDLLPIVTVLQEQADALAVSVLVERDVQP